MRLTISLLCHLWSGGHAGLRPARLVDGDDSELILLTLHQSLESDGGQSGVETLPDLPLPSRRGLGLDVVSSDGHAAIVDGSLPLEGHTPLVVLGHVGLAGGQGHGWRK